MELSMEPWYATREDVMSATDIKVSAFKSAQIDADLDSASRTAEGLMHRKFYPWTGTRYFDFPNPQRSNSWRVWFDQFDMISLASVLNGDGTSVSTANIFLNPQDGPPYTYAEVSLASSSAFSAGSTWQRALAFTGLWGWSNDQVPGGTLTASVNSSVTSVAASDSSLIGIGSLLTVGTERMIVTGKTLATTTATITADLAAGAGTTSVPISSGALVNTGEYITVGSESMQVVDKTGNTLIVVRAVSGSVLATHTNGDTVYAPRTLTVVRAATGTTAGAHTNGDTVTAWQSPGPMKTLTVALAVATGQKRNAGWVGSPPKAVTTELDMLIQQTRNMFGYGNFRSAAV